MSATPFMWSFSLQKHQLSLSSNYFNYNNNNLSKSSKPTFVSANYDNIPDNNSNHHDSSNVSNNDSNHNNTSSSNFKIIVIHLITTFLIMIPII